MNKMQIPPLMNSSHSTFYMLKYFQNHSITLVCMTKILEVEDILSFIKLQGI